MGSNCLISCRECFYMREFRIGIGMLYSPEALKDLDSKYALLPDLIKSEETLAHIRELLEEKNADIADGYGHRIYRCPNCGEFQENFYLRLDYDGGSYEVPYNCPECGAPLELVDLNTGGSGWGEVEPLDIKNIPVPSAASMDYNIRRVGFCGISATIVKQQRWIYNLCPQDDNMGCFWSIPF